jgi:hypothetical protein
MNNTHQENSGFEACQIYTGLKLHFTTKYDYVKYGGKTNVSKDSFMLRKDKYFFYKLSRKYSKEELFGFYVANFLENPKVWIGNLLSEDCDSTYKVWMKTQQSLSYIFDQDLNTLFDLVDKPDQMLKVVDGDYPLLYNLYKQDTVKLETVIILDDIMNFIPMWTKKVSDDLIFPDFVRVCDKYKPFINYDKAKMIGLVKSKLVKEAA